MSNQHITVSWSNNAISNSVNKLYLQRTTQLNFFHSKAHITTIEDEQTKSIDLLSTNCSYRDLNVEPGKYHTYRVVMDTAHGKCSSVPTTPTYVSDLQTDIGYPSGTPESTYNYNIDIAPTLHLDAGRIYNTSDENNDVIQDARGIIRHNTTSIHTIDTQGDPVFDSRTVRDHRSYMCAKTTISYNQSHNTQDVENTSMQPVMSQDIEYNTGATIFVALYTEYNPTGVDIKYKLSHDHMITWSDRRVECDTPAGTIFSKRRYNQCWSVLMCRYTPVGVKLWENGRYIGATAHVDGTKFLWNKHDSIDLLGCNNSNCGLSELMLFDHSLPISTIDTINYYLCNKYATECSSIDPRDL